MGEGAGVGNGSVMDKGSKLGKNSLLGAGSFLRENLEIPEGEVWVGNPAKFLKRNDFK